MAVITYSSRQLSLVQLTTSVVIVALVDSDSFVLIVQTDDSVESVGLRLPSPERLQRQGGVHHLEQLAGESSESAAIPSSTCTV